VEPDGRTRRLLAPDVAVEVLDRWTSPASGAVYPSRWRVRVPAENLDFEVVPLVRDQEMRTSFTYWEGAVRLSGRGPRGPVAGRGYVEMTGYSRTMQGVF
jgi:predicted secreted hydrolase